MRNRAKCKLCKAVIESLEENDMIRCSCGEIAITGGIYSYRAYAQDFNNFLRIDDEEKEIPVSFKEKKDVKPLDNEETPKPTKKDLLYMLDEMVKNIERLPAHAMITPINHYDFCSLIILLSSIFRTED